MTTDELTGVFADDESTLADDAGRVAELKGLLAEELLRKSSYSQDDEERGGGTTNDELDRIFEFDDCSISSKEGAFDSSLITVTFVPESSEQPAKERTSAAMEAHFTKAEVFNKLKFIIRPYFFI